MVFRLAPRHIAGQMMAVLGVSFILLLGTMAVFELLESGSVVDTADSDFTARRLMRMLPIVQSIPAEQLPAYLERVSHCHDGYAVSKMPYSPIRITERLASVKRSLADRLSMDATMIQVGHATLYRDDFSYRQCDLEEIQFPVEAMVVSLRIDRHRWLNVEIHPHEWHLTPSMTDWLIRSLAAFLVIGGIASVFVHRLSQPYKQLADAANAFASELEVTELEETGPSDAKQAIQSFNRMQRQVSDEMRRRASTLAAISHDIRTPLTALRVKTELIEDENVRADHIASIDKMEKITASALDFLRGESRNEPKRQVDLGELVDSVCAEFQEQCANVRFYCPNGIYLHCRPNALLRAITNLLENAVKYAGNADVSILPTESLIAIIVADAGPGISPDKLATVLKPFERLSDARDSDKGGFGLGLAIVKAVVEGHDGELILLANSPTGLIARIELPCRPGKADNLG